jgi:hypothetical protein
MSKQFNDPIGLTRKFNTDSQLLAIRFALFHDEPDQFLNVWPRLTVLTLCAVDLGSMCRTRVLAAPSASPETRLFQCDGRTF